MSATRPLAVRRFCARTTLKPNRPLTAQMWKGAFESRTSSVCGLTMRSSSGPNRATRRIPLRSRCSSTRAPAWLNYCREPIADRIADPRGARSAGGVPRHLGNRGLDPCRFDGVSWWCQERRNRMRTWKSTGFVNSSRASRGRVTAGGAVNSGEYRS